MGNVWGQKHQRQYAGTDWIDKPSLFAETAIGYFPSTGKVLELGAGSGQDTRFFAGQGYTVTSTDFDQGMLEINESKLPKELAANITLKQVDLREELPFENDTFDVVYAHLALHYFDSETTRRIVDQARRVLKTGGVFAFLVNSADDPEYGTGEELEQDYFQLSEFAKRFFTVNSVRTLTKYFEVSLLDNHGETYKDRAKGIDGLVRFIGTKPAATSLGGGLAIPCVGAIVEREVDGEVEVLVQTRWKPGSDPVYSGTLEFPAGKLDVPFQNIFDALAQELHDETGLTLQSIRGEDKTEIMNSGRDDEVFGFKPFCCTQQLKNGMPWISYIFVCTVAPGDTVDRLSETRNVRWMKVSELKRLYHGSPNTLFAFDLPAWEYYFAEQKADA